MTQHVTNPLSLKKLLTLCMVVSSILLCLQKEESLPAFKSSSHAIAKTLLQLAGEFDFEDTFNRGDLLYGPTAYILFITFLITMPILFINLLVSCCCTVVCMIASELLSTTKLRPSALPCCRLTRKAS